MKILDSLPPSEQQLAEFLSKKFVILPHQLRPDEETLHCVVGPELTAHRYAAVHRAESGAKKQYDAFYWDPAVGMYETISATSNKHTKEREPCLSTLRRDQILLVFDKLSRRQIPRDTLRAFVDRPVRQTSFDHLAIVAGGGFPSGSDRPDAELMGLFLVTCISGCYSLQNRV